ncbi:hypothetical protein I4200191B4_05990 [Pseudoflavonifractor gallinarum]
MTRLSSALAEQNRLEEKMAKQAVVDIVFHSKYNRKEALWPKKEQSTKER